MATSSIWTCALAAAALALAIVFAPADSKAQATKQAPVQPGSAVAGTDVGNGCVARCNVFGWCHIRWRIRGGTLPTLFHCRKGFCPPMC